MPNNRTYEQIKAAQDALYKTKTESAIANLPPGYFIGFNIIVNDYGQLVVGKGVMNWRGHRADQTASHIVNGEDFILPDYIIKGTTYYIYYSYEKDYKIDSVEPILDETNFGYSHPTLLEYRYLGRADLGIDGTWSNVLNQNPVQGEDIDTDSLQANSIISRSITATELETLMLQADIIYVGYEGTGNISSPQEGDTVCYISGTTIEFREYSGSSWIITNGLKIGGQTSSLFNATIGCRGIYHPNNPLTSVEYFPHQYFRVFNFENDYEDQNGSDDWGSKEGLGFNGTTHKFGVFSLESATPGGYGNLIGPSGALMGSNQSMGLYFYFHLTDGETDPAASFAFAKISYYADRIALYISKQNNSNDCKIKIVVGKSSSIVESTELDYIINDGSWNYVAFAYDSVSDIIKVSLNNNPYYESGALGGTWAGETAYIQLFPYNARVAGGFTTTIIYDELIYAYNYYTDINYFIQHYTHDIAWATTYTKSDIIHQPDTNGRDVFTKDVLIENNLIINHDITASTFNGETLYQWQKVTDPPTGWLDSKTSWTGTDNFDTHGKIVDYSSVVPVGAIAVLAVCGHDISAGTTFYRKNGDTNVSNTPEASGDDSHVLTSEGSNSNIRKPYFIWLGADYKIQVTTNNVNTDLYFAYPIAILALPGTVT